MIKKGIILAGGTGTRLSPLTKAVNKQLLPVYDKPLIFYPLSILMLAGIKNILIIVNDGQEKNFSNILGNGKRYGINIEYKTQKKPRGIAEAFILGKNFIKKDSVSLILGDNFFYGQSLTAKLLKSKNQNKGATIFLKSVNNPENFGVAVIKNYKISIIVEKPKKFISKQAITGLYFYDNTVVAVAKSIKPSDRGELEITTVNDHYLQAGKLKVAVLERGTAWLDTGTFRSLQDAGEFVRVMEDRTGTKVGCVEEISWRNGWISSEQLLTLAQPLLKSGYGDYLVALANK